MTLVNEILAASAEVENGRTIQDILTHAMTELGELAQEVQIAEGKSYKQQGSDSVVGEALDVINCMIDIIYVHYGVLADEHYLTALNDRKLSKWKEKAKQVKEMKNG